MKIHICYSVVQSDHTRNWQSFAVIVVFFTHCCFILIAVFTHCFFTHCCFYPLLFLPLLFLLIAVFYPFLFLLIAVFTHCFFSHCCFYSLFFYSLLFFTLDAGLLARSQNSEGPATGHLDTGFLGFPVSISKCSDGSQHSKLPLHASHVALPT